MQTSKPDNNSLDKLNQFESAVITIAVISNQLIDELFKQHKELNIHIDSMERLAWNKIKDGAASLEHRVFMNKHCNYNKFKKSVLMVKFLMLELIARCDDSDMRVWKFYNLLKTYKIVYPGVVRSIEDEKEAFSELFNPTE